VLPLPVQGLPAALEGLRIVHLSDFHLGVPSRGRRAVEAGVEWAAERQPDLVVATGDLLTRPQGLPELQARLARLPGALLVLGNHDVGLAKDPLARPTPRYDPAPALLLEDQAIVRELRCCRVQVVGMHPEGRATIAARAAGLADPDADFRILLVHYPEVADELPAGAFHLVLSGHIHDGQIAIPYGFGKLRLGDPLARYVAGAYRIGDTALHVSPGLGTTFVPFRFFARAEATELVLQSA
jgi:predicted MPP superfamily phosphohydrolase